MGAGAGATIGKAAGLARAMKGGVGSAAITMADGLIVAALVVVNAFGDVIDPATGQVVAGVRSADGRDSPTRASCCAPEPSVPAAAATRRSASSRPTPR